MYTVMHPNDADRMANSVDPDQTGSRSALLWIITGAKVVKKDLTDLYFKHL